MKNLGNRMKCIAACLLFCAMLTGCGKFFRYILTDDTASYTRITFHEMYGQDNIDVLFVGSSHCYRSFVPAILDERLGLCTFNGGTSSQGLDGSYMVIREAAKYHDIKHIYLELYYAMAFDTYKARTEMTQTYIISDYLKPSLDKVRYLLGASAKEHYPNSFIVARRDWAKFFDADYVKDLILKKGTDAYKNYEYAHLGGESERYAGKGYVANRETVEDWDYFSDKSWDKIALGNISDDWFQSLEDIIAFCGKKGIPLTFVSAPMPNYLLASAGNYDEYVGLVRKTIAGTGVDYYDFNLCKDGYFPNTSSLFKDVDHVNCYGAEKCSYLLADLIKGKITENELFYGSYEEKLKNLEPTVFGVSCHDNGGRRDCKIVSTGNDGMEYEVNVSPAEGEPYKLQEFSSNRFFTVDPQEHGVITVTYRLSSFPDKERSVAVSY